MLAKNRYLFDSDGLIVARNLYYKPTAVRLKLEQNQLVGCHAAVRFVIAARKRLLQGHLLEQGDRQYL